jgi:hypothetical protein
MSAPSRGSSRTRILTETLYALRRAVVVPPSALYPMFNPIITPAQVDALLAGAEHLQVDMKGGVRAYRYFEKGADKGWNNYAMAKDVAAFANANGGTLLIGAEEDRATGKLAKFASVDPADAKALRDALAEAVKERCCPQPLVDARTIRRGSDELLAFNVWPFFGQVVGVKVSAEPEHVGDYAGDAVVYPLRRNAHVYPLRQIDRTIYLTAEQVPMFMIPEIRRVAALLSAIPINDPINLPGQRAARLRWRPHRTMPGTLTSHADCRLISIEPMQNAVEGLVPRFLAKTTKGGSPGIDVSFSIPLEDVRSVWKEGSFWWVLVAGYFEATDGCRYLPEHARADL